MAEGKARAAPGDRAATDGELVAACLAGDERAWTALIDRYGAYVRAIAIRAYGLDPAAADDVFQDTCVRLYDGLEGFAGRSEFRSWLRAVVLSACRDHLRRTARDRPDPVPEPQEPLEEIEAALDVRAAVDGLGEPCRETIRLYFFAGLTQAEVAGRLGVPPGTIAARLSRCLRRLRDRLQESGGPPASRG